MGQSICAVACPFITGTGSDLGNRAITDSLSSYLSDLMEVLNLCFFLYGNLVFMWPLLLAPSPYQLPCLFYI